MKKDPPDDTIKIRCPKLGHQIHFSYCRSENLGLPCAKILNCWFSYFDVEGYLREELTEEDFKRIFLQPQKSKAQSLMDMIDQALQQKKNDD